MDQVSGVISLVSALLKSSDFSIIVKIIFIVLALTSGFWYKALKKKLNKATSRAEEQANQAKNEGQIRQENTVENQQASSDSSKVDDFLK